MGNHLFLEDLLEWIQSFASDEGPRQAREGGAHGVQTIVKPTVIQLTDLVREAREPKGKPRGYATGRVQEGFDELIEQLVDLAELLDKIEHDIPSNP